METNGLGELTSEKYVRLTTFKRDGTAVPTPVWIAPDGNDLLVLTSTSTGKIKRIRHTERVLVAACDARGRLKPGSADRDARATIDLDPAHVRDLRRRIVRRYSIVGSLFIAATTAYKKLGRMKGEEVALRLSA
jgi:PPOX class probable F420-dependent enzyme